MKCVTKERCYAKTVRGKVLYLSPTNKASYIQLRNGTTEVYYPNQERIVLPTEEFRERFIRVDLYRIKNVLAGIATAVSVYTIVLFWLAITPGGSL